MTSFRLFLLLFLCTAQLATAQIDDIGLWTGITVEHKFTRRISGDLTQQLRMYKDLYQVDQLYSQAGVSYAFSKNFRGAIAYRYSYKDREGYYSNRHRLQADLSYRFKYKDLIIQLRERIQRQVVDPGASENGHIPEWIWRNRIALKADLGKKYEPYISAEFYNLLDNADEDPFGLTRIRYEIGADYKFNRVHSLNPFILFQYGIPDMQNRLVYGLSYTLSI
jgi:hypothetical protein